MISFNMARCLRHLEVMQPIGVTLWPLGCVGLSQRMAQRCVQFGYARLRATVGAPRVEYHITKRGLDALRTHGARAA